MRKQDKPKQGDTVTIQQLKQQYNTLLMREVKAEAYFDNPDIPPEDKLYQQPEYEGIIRELNNILKQLKDIGISYTGDEILGGFEV